MSSASERVVVRRPRHRKTQILEAAATLLQRTDYQRVTMEAIASEVGITVGALYRHFPGKQELLDQVMVDEVTAFERALRVAEGGTVTELCEILVDRVLDAPGGTATLFRHLRTLSADTAELVRARLRSATSMLQQALLRERDDLGDSDADTIAWAILAVTGSPTLYRTHVRRSAQRDLLLKACRRVCAISAATTSDGGAGPVAQEPPAAPTTRREQILQAVATLSQEHGFANLTMEQIAARVGIATSTLYNHFDSKLSMVSATFLRSAELLRREAEEAEGTSADPRAILTTFARSYIKVALTEPGAPIYFVTAESSLLPHEFRRMMRDYVDRWVRHLSLGPREGRMVVLAALATVNYLTLTPHVANRPGFATDLEHLVLAVLDVGLDVGMDRG